MKKIVVILMAAFLIVGCVAAKDPKLYKPNGEKRIPNPKYK